jgi:hypothetical protein
MQLGTRRLGAQRLIFSIGQIGVRASSYGRTFVPGGARLVLQDQSWMHINIGICPAGRRVRKLRVARQKSSRLIGPHRPFGVEKFNPAQLQFLQGGVHL